LDDEFMKHHVDKECNTHDTNNIGKSHGKRLLGRCRHKFQDNIKMLCTVPAEFGIRCHTQSMTYACGAKFYSDWAQGLKIDIRES
jgi:hypothetical protein